MGHSCWYSWGRDTFCNHSVEETLIGWLVDQVSLESGTRRSLANASKGTLHLVDGRGKSLACPWYSGRRDQILAIPYTLATKNASRRMDNRLLDTAGDDELHVFRHPVRGTNERNGWGALEILITYILDIWRNVRTGEDVRRCSMCRGNLLFISSHAKWLVCQYPFCIIHCSLPFKCSAHNDDLRKVVFKSILVATNLIRLANGSCLPWRQSERREYSSSCQIVSQLVLSRATRPHVWVPS